MGMEVVLTTVLVMNFNLFFLLKFKFYFILFYFILVFLDSFDVLY